MFHVCVIPHSQGTLLAPLTQLEELWLEQPITGDRALRDLAGLRTFGWVGGALKHTSAQVQLPLLSRPSYKGAPQLASLVAFRLLTIRFN
jgi:hypothetical protein